MGEIAEILGGIATNILDDLLWQRTPKLSLAVYFFLCGYLGIVFLSRNDDRSIYIGVAFFGITFFGLVLLGLAGR